MTTPDQVCLRRKLDRSETTNNNNSETIAICIGKVSKPNFLNEWVRHLLLLTCEVKDEESKNDPKKGQLGIL